MSIYDAYIHSSPAFRVFLLRNFVNSQNFPNNQNISLGFFPDKGKTAGGIDVCQLWVLSGRGPFHGLIPRSEESYWL